MTLCKSKSGGLQPGKTGTKPKYPNSKDVKRMTETLVEVLTKMVYVVKIHRTLIEALERREFVKTSSEGIALKQVTFLLAEPKTPQSAESVPSDQM